jgi:hypothetical protein
VGYESSGAIMEIEFTSGKVYRYYAVSEHIYLELIRAESAGTFFNQMIKGRYPFEALAES